MEQRCHRRSSAKRCISYWKAVGAPICVLEEERVERAPGLLDEREKGSQIWTVCVELEAGVLDEGIDCLLVLKVFSIASKIV